MPQTTLGEVFESQAVWSKLFSVVPDDVHLAFALAEIQQEVERHFSLFARVRNQYAAKYGHPAPDGKGFVFAKVNEAGELARDEKGELIPDREAIGLFNEKMEELVAQDVEISQQVSREQLETIWPELGVSVQDLSKILWLISSS